MYASQCAWAAPNPWENEFRWKQTSESVSKACCLIMMMSGTMMRALIDTKQMASALKVTQLHYDVLHFQHRYRDGSWCTGDKAGICIEMKCEIDVHCLRCLTDTSQET